MHKLPHRRFETEYHNDFRLPRLLDRARTALQGGAYAAPASGAC